MRDPELLVIGGGPAGLGAAIEAGRRGVDVILADEQNRPGGQLFKQIHKFFGSKEHFAGTRGYDIGTHLLEEAGKTGVSTILSTRVIGIFPDGRVSLLSKTNGLFTIRPGSVVIATGAGERGVVFPGWMLPGVITAGAAQTFCNIHRVLPGEKVVMMGSGNVGLIVAYQLLQAGADVHCIVEARESLGGYRVHAAKVLRAGVPILTGYSIKEARGVGKVEEVVLSAIDSSCSFIPDTEKVLEADTICLAVGLHAVEKLPVMAGCRMLYSDEFKAFLPFHDRNMETSVQGIFVAGDAAGVEEANTALEEGRIAGIGAAFSLGKTSWEACTGDIDNVWIRLMALREGTFGRTRRIGKDRIVRSASEKPQVRKSGGAFEVPAIACADTFLLHKEEPLRGKGKNPVAVIHCDQDIPCDPCVFSCPVGAIGMEPPISGLPVLDMNACTGCGLCLPLCPGQAIFLYQEQYDDSRFALTFVYEFSPLPEKGDTVAAVNRFGEVLCEAEVVKVATGIRLDRSPLITIACDKNYSDVRFIRRIPS